MKNKILISTLMLFVLVTVTCSYSYATNMMNSAGNAMMNVGNTIENAATATKDTIVNGTQNLVNGVSNIGNDTMNGVNDMGNDAMNGIDNMTDSTAAAQSMDVNDDYTAQRTATPNTGLFGMTNNTSTWLILGIVGAIIIGLVWYYGAQYEQKNYNND